MPSILPSTRRCTKCGEEKPATAEYFYRNNRRNKEGLFSHCIACHKKRHAENRERLNEINRQSYARHREERNAVSRAYHESHRADISQQKQQYYIENKERIQQYRRGNRDMLRASGRRYYELHREHYRELNRLYHIEHREAILEHKRKTGPEYRKRNVDVRRERHRKWRMANINRCRLAGSKRRARVRSLPATFTHEQWLFCLEYWRNRCAVCGHQLRDLFGHIEPHFDHWIPITNPACPGTTADNMVCLCSDCNLSKHDKDAKQWLIRKFGKRKAAEILARVTAYFDSIE
jgi:hypothetical protein